MKNLIAVLVTVVGVASVGFGQATTMPAVAQPTKVLIIPFGQIGNSGHEWVGSAIEDNLVTQAAANGQVEAIGLNHPLDHNTRGDALFAAQGAAAQIVVFGSYQFVDDQVRVNGQALDVPSGRTIGTLTATGAILDLFKMEDTLSGQLATVLPQPPSNVPTVDYGSPQAPVAQAPAAQGPVTYYAGNQPDQTDQSTAAAPPAQTYVYSSPTYVYGYPYTYSYGYPYYYGAYYGGFPIYYYGGFGRGYYYRGGWGYHPGYVGIYRGGVGFGVGFRAGGGRR